MDENVKKILINCIYKLKTQKPCPDETSIRKALKLLNYLFSKFEISYLGNFDSDLIHIIFEDKSIVLNIPVNNCAVYNFKGIVRPPRDNCSLLSQNPDYKNVSTQSSYLCIPIFWRNKIKFIFRFGYNNRLSWFEYNEILKILR